MSLTSTAFFAFTLIMVVALTVMTVVAWNRVPGPRPVRLATRLLMIVISQVAAVLAVLVWVNNSYGLYQSWSDLLGTTGGQVHIATGGRLGTTSGGTPDGPRRHGHLVEFTNFKPDILTATATGPRSHITGDVYVWLPPQYQDPVYRHTTFPVVELLPGYPGSPQAWFGAMAVHKRLARMITAHQVRPMILVAPKMNVLGNVDPGCADIPHGSRTATWLGQDVPNLIKDNFRAATDARHWATMGYSAGAYCAVNLTLHFPRTIHAAVSLSGYNAPISALVNQDQAVARANNPYLRLRDAKRQPDVALLMAGSRQDGDTVFAANALLAALHHHGASRLLTVSHGGHNMRVWRLMLPTALVWISQVMPTR
jgi:enterochelin esterase-like enzyme